MLDCGADENDGFSPARMLRSRYNIQSLDFLLVSHPHVDHIRDIINVDNSLHATTFSRNRIINEPKIREENSEVFETHEDIINKYLEMDSRYDQPVPTADRSNSSDWAEGTRIVTFANQDYNMNLNDLSRIAFIENSQHTILYGGDLEERGWKELLSQEHFIDWLKSVDILIASHHGRESGFSSEIFQYCKPKLTIVSDGRFGDTSATDRYVSVTSGMRVRNNNASEDRKVITTRNDGHIFLQSDGTNLSVNLCWQPS